MQGRWFSYVPGPRADIPWLDAGTQAGNDAEALADGQVVQASAGLRLLTPLDEAPGHPSVGMGPEGGR